MQYSDNRLKTGAWVSDLEFAIVYVCFTTTELRLSVTVSSKKLYTPAIVQNLVKKILPSFISSNSRIFRMLVSRCTQKSGQTLGIILIFN